MGRKRNGKPTRRVAIRHWDRPNDPLKTALTVESDWANRHYEELVKRFPHKIVAITHEQVAGVGDTGDEAIAQAHRKYPGVIPLLVRVPSSEDLVCVL